MIDDIEELKKENITIEDSNKEFDDNIKKFNNLKDTIDYEMKEIDKEYDKICEEITKSYGIKRERLKNEENDLKDELKNNVTKIKEKLEITASEINNLLRISNKLVKGIKSLEKEEKIMIKMLSYISQINKTQKEMNKIFNQMMKNLKISYFEEKNKIKFEEYYFNGIPVPKYIEFKDIEANSFKVLWKIDDINILNIDKNEIKYKIEIKKENINNNFIQVYEGSENYNIIDKLERNTNYEIKICSIFKDIRSEWSEIHKIKTKETISAILNESERGNEFLEKLYEWTGYQKIELLYRGTRDGASSGIFHNKCDNQGPTLCLCKNEKDNIFGGYSSISWTNYGNYKSANGSFLFSLTSIHNTPPTKFPNTQNFDKAIYHHSNWGPDFGDDLFIGDNYLNNNSSGCERFGSSYPDILGKGRSIFSGDLYLNNFKLKELEVFKLIN